MEAELRGRGYDVVAPDLPETAAGLTEYADAVIDAVGGRRHLVVVGQSFGAFTAPLVAARVSTDVLVLVAGMVPAPGEAPDDWWEHTGYSSAVQEQAARDGGMTGNDDPFVTFYHDVPRALAEEAMRRERHGSLGGMSSPWPLEAWPDVPTRFVLCTADRFFPPAFLGRVVADRLGIVVDEIDSGHCAALAQPEKLAELLAGYVA
ncbi:MAG TPA: alpha/beta hydrolase [Jiangellaceae bacterium]|nr:alpha/beta hydrolase [Jiangellaceae bacterium]